MGGPPGGERLTSEERLTRRRDYLRCYREGHRRHGRFAILYLAAGPQSHPRLGVTASRKVGKAVIRHRLRRRVREVFRRWEGRRRLPPVDLVVHLRPPAADASFDALRTDLLGLLEAVASRPGDRVDRVEHLEQGGGAR